MTRFVQVISVLANGTGAAVKSDSNSGSVAGFLEEAMSWLAKVGDMIWNGLMTFFVKIVQFMLRIVDFLQYFVGKLAGIDTWSAKGDVGNVRLADTDVIFRFLMSDSVMKAFIAIVGLSIVLLIVFTIVAIVKTDYSAATDADGKADGNKRSVMKKTGRALFVMLIVPFVLVFGILGSNAVLASLNNALKGNSTISLGGQIFSASSYEANRYRKYADSGRRTPVDFGTEVLDTVFVPEKGQKALGGLVKVDGTYLFVAPMGYKVGGEINGTTMSVANLYERKKNEDNSLVGDETQLDAYTHVGYVRYYWDGTIKKVDLKGNELANAQNFVQFPGLTVDGKLLNYESIDGGKGSFGLYELGYMGADKKDEKNIINAVYNTWKYNNSVYEKYNSVNAESTTVATATIVQTLADRDNQKAVYTFANAGTYGFDGEFAPIEEEYYVMADFVDYALEHGLTFYFVNSSNPLVEWNANKDLGAKGVSEAYLTGTEANGKIGSVSGFVVEYATGIDRYYEARRGASNEIDGETFIVCTRVGDYYVPVTQSESRGSGFVSSYLADGYTGPIVARGLFDDKGNPTYISNISESEVTVVSYYKMLGTGGAIAGGTDNIDGGDAMIGTYQKANGVLQAYNSAGSEVGAGNIVFSHVKVDEIYVENGLQYIELHFYELIGEDNQQASNYEYLFSASVIGTPAESDGVEFYVSSVFASSTIFTVNGKAVSALPEKNILSNTVKYIYFNRTDMSKDLMLDFALGFNGKTASMLEDEGNSFYARFKLGMIYDFGTNTVYHLTNGSALIDYNFMTEDGIALANLYRPGDLNIIILLFATILIFTVLFQAVWGLISRIYEIVLMFILYPGFVSTIPIDDGSRFKKWRENVVQKVLGAYGVILGINLFFILLPVVRDATYIFEADDIPAALQGRGFFGNADFLNRIVYILFLLVLFTLIKTLPGLVAGLVGGSDVYADGGKVKENVDKSVKAVSNVVTGKSLLSAGSKAKDMLTGFIPGGAIAKVAYGAGKKLVDKAKDKAAKASGGSGGAPGGGSGGAPGGAGGPGGGPGRSGGDHSEPGGGPGRSGGDHSERDDVPPTRTSTVESSDESVVASEPVAVEAESEPIVMREGEVVPIAGEVESSATRAEFVARAESVEHAAAGEAGEATERTFADLSEKERKKLKKENRAEYDRLKSAHAIAQFEEKERNKAKKELADYAERKTKMNKGQKILAGVGLGQKVVDFKKKKIDKKKENLGKEIDEKIEGKIEREAAKLDRMSSRREHRQRIKEKLDARLVQPVRKASREVYDKVKDKFYGSKFYGKMTSAMQKAKEKTESFVAGAKEVYDKAKDKFYGSKFYGKMTPIMQKAKEKTESFVAGAKKVGAFVAKGAKAFGKGVAKVAVGTAKVLTFPLRAAKVIKKNGKENVEDTKSKLAKLRETGESAVFSDRKVKIQKPEFTLSQMTGMTISELEKLVNKTLAKMAAVAGAKGHKVDGIRKKFIEDYGVDIYVLANRLEKAIRRKTKIGTHGVPIKKTYVPRDGKWVGKSRNVDYDVETAMKASKKEIEGTISNLEKTVSGTFVSEEALKLLDKKTKKSKDLIEIRRKNADLERQIKALKGSEFKAGEDYETALNAAKEAARDLETLVNTFKTDKLNEDLRESIFGAKGSSTAPVDGETE